MPGFPYQPGFNRVIMKISHYNFKPPWSIEFYRMEIFFPELKINVVLICFARKLKHIYYPFFSTFSLVVKHSFYYFPTSILFDVSDKIRNIVFFRAYN